jgi:spore coat protein U-like protein
MTAKRAQARPVWQRALIGAALLLGVAGVQAQSCTASTTGIAFGTYNPLSLVANDSTGNVSVTCAANPVILLLAYQVALSAGSSGSYAARTMTSAAQSLQYQLYSDAGRLTVWGNGSAGTLAVNGAFLLSIIAPMSANHPVYARVPALQSAAGAGVYGDVVTVTVSY